MLEEILRRRVDQIERLLGELRTKGENVEQLLNHIYTTDAKISELWRQVDTDIESHSNRSGVAMEEALEWLEALDAWSTAVVNHLRRSAEDEDQQ